MGRKKIEIDWNRVDNALMAGSNGVQVAAMLGIHYNTLVNKCKEDKKCDFSEYLQQKRQKGNNLLHAKQYELAMKGDRGMLIWLGKQRLEQTDKNDIKQETKTSTVNVNLTKTNIPPITKESDLFDDD